VWLIVLTVVVVLWLGLFVVPTYVTLNPDQSRTVLLDSFPMHYAVLIAHIGGGLLALVTGCLQMFARLRVRWPRLHRITGRVYVLAVLTSAPASGALVAASVVRDSEQGVASAGTSLTVGNSICVVLWFGTTLLAWRMARRRRFAEHRRLMIYSFALTLSILYSRPLIGVAISGVIPGFTLETFFHNVGWLPWVVNLIFAQWWLNRTARRPLALPAGVAGP
jgi:hypothetical protein